MGVHIDQARYHRRVACIDNVRRKRPCFAARDRDDSTAFHVDVDVAAIFAMQPIEQLADLDRVWLGSALRREFQRLCDGEGAFGRRLA